MSETTPQDTTPQETTTTSQETPPQETRPQEQETTPQEKKQTTPQEKKQQPKEPKKKVDKRLAAARKEGAKKGQDLSGLQDMGGVCYFHVALENSDGKWEYVEAAMKGANTPVDTNGDDRKGGAQDIGKAFFSASDDSLCIYLHVPEAVSDKVSVHEWLDVIVKALPEGYKVLQAPSEDSPFGFAKVHVERSKCKGEVFPLKLRDEVIGLGFAFLRTKKVVPEDEDSSEYEIEGGYEW